MFGFLLTYDKNLTFYANISNDKYNSLLFFEILYKIKFKSIIEFNSNNYDYIINHTDDNVNTLILDKSKLIVIEHELYERISLKNKNQYLSVHKFNFNKRNIILPVFKFISKEDKLNILKNELTINVIYFNNKEECNDISPSYISSLKKILNVPGINLYYRSNYAITKLLDFFTENNINLINIENKSMIELMNYYKICHYSIIGNENLIKFSGNICLSLSSGCQLLCSDLRKLSINSNSIQTFNTNLTLNTNLDIIYDDIIKIISSNNNLLNSILL